MADVRLTATNPADSSVVPVACNAKGELKLEDFPDQSFDGNLQGDLTVSGSADFDGVVGVGTPGSGASADPGAQVNPLGSFAAYKPVRNNGQSDSGLDNFIVFRSAPDSASQRQTVYRVASDGTVNIGGAINTPIQPGIQLNADGSASFAGDVQVGGNAGDITNESLGGFNFYTGGAFDMFRASNTGAQTLIKADSLMGNSNSRVEVFKLTVDGSAAFAGNKAGFTAEGYLWCTTRRGDTVILDVTSNGLASWVPYTPPNRLTELQDKWAEKDGILPVPHESSQDEPETPQ